MKNLKELEDKIKKLGLYDRNMLIFELLYENIISFTEITNMYISSLEKQKEDQRINIYGLVNMLSCFVPKTKIKNQRFVEAKSAWHIMKTKIYEGTPLGERYKRIIKKSGYKEDEEGNPNKVIEKAKKKAKKKTKANK